MWTSGCNATTCRLWRKFFSIPFCSYCYWVTDWLAAALFYSLAIFFRSFSFASSFFAQWNVCVCDVLCVMCFFPCSFLLFFCLWNETHPLCYSNEVAWRRIYIYINSSITRKAHFATIAAMEICKNISIYAHVFVRPKWNRTETERERESNTYAHTFIHHRVLWMIVRRH